MNRDKWLVVSLETAKKLKKSWFKTLTDSFYMDLDWYILQERVDWREVVLLEKSDILAPNAMELKKSLLSIYNDIEITTYEKNNIFYAKIDIFNTTFCDPEVSWINEQEALAELYLSIINK